MSRSTLSLPARALVESLDALELTGRVLVADDETEMVLRAVRGRGHDAAAWHRLARTGRVACPWPEPGPYDVALLRLARSRHELRMLIHAVAAVTPPGGRVVLYGANSEGIRSAGTILQDILGEVTVAAVRRHSRILVAVRPTEIAGLKGRLEDWRQTVELAIAGQGVPWVFYPGLFAEGRLDAGTELLVSAIPSPAPGDCVLDFGAGTGIVGWHILRQQPAASVDLLDIDSLATAAQRVNVPGARAYLTADSLAATGAGAYDLIVSNPTLHDGAREDHGVLAALVAEAPRHLKPGGALMMVVQRRIALTNSLTEAFGGGEVVAETSRFRVWRARRP
ncbi:MAG: class I SAM-dependent methyltransferase [Hyphomicrobiaceae bacterium]|nr:class I SAM-dependent methyltransferase [Hyphomicrobiaceae bacterium]